MVILEPEKFLTELEKCYTVCKAKRKGSLFVTMKRYDGRTKPVPRNPEDKKEPSEPLCLVRVAYGKRKLSTRIKNKDLNKFQIAFSSLMRSGMSNIGKKSTQPAVKSELTTAGKGPTKSRSNN